MTDLVHLRGLMSTADLRAGSEAVVEAMLLDMKGADDDDAAPAWVAEAAHRSGVTVGELTVGEIRRRLRGTLEELARFESPR